MNDWIKSNLWAIIITGIGVISSFTLYGSRIGNLEQQVTENKVAIQTLNTAQTQVQVQLAQISVDIQYIKVAIDKLTK